MVSTGEFVTLPSLSLVYVDHLPPIITRMYQYSWTPETPRVWFGRSGMVMVLPSGLTEKLGGLIVTGGGPVTALPGSKNPTCCTFVKPEPRIVSGSVTVPAVSTGYESGSIEVSAALALSLVAYRMTGDWE